MTDSDDVVEIDTTNLLISAINNLNKRVQELEARVVSDSWRENPDRMGGCFTDAEKTDTGWH